MVDHVEHLKQEALHWHRFRKCNGSPQNGDIAELRRITRARYHRAIRQVESDTEIIKMERMVQARLSNSSRDMWSEAYNSKGHNQTLSYSIDGDTCDMENANVFL